MIYEGHRVLSQRPTWCSTNKCYQFKLYAQNDLFRYLLSLWNNIMIIAECAYNIKFVKIFDKRFVYIYICTVFKIYSMYRVLCIYIYAQYLKYIACIDYRVKTTVVGSIPTRGNDLFNISIKWVTAGRWVPLYVNSKSKSLVPSAHPSTYGIQREAKKCIDNSIFILAMINNFK